MPPLFKGEAIFYKDGSAFGSTFFLPSTWKGYWLIKPFEMSKEVNSEIIDEKKSDSLK